MYLPKLLDRYLSGGNGRMQNLEGYKGALSVRDVGLDDVNEATSTGDAVIHALLKRGPRKYITVAVSCEAAVDFDIDFSVDDGETYVAGSTVTIQMDGAGSAIENIINNRPDLTHIKVTPSGAGTYTVVTTVSSHAPEINANVLVDGVTVASDNPLPVTAPPSSAYNASTGAALTVILDTGDGARNPGEVWVKSSAAATFTVSCSRDGATYRTADTIPLAAAGEKLRAYDNAYRFIKVATTAANNNEIEIAAGR